MKKVFIITGELSGEKHASEVVRELKRINPGAVVEGVGGKNLEEQGVKIFSNHDKMSVVGLNFKAIYDHLTLGKRIVNYLKNDYKPDVVLLIDYGVFNLSIAKVLKKQISAKIYYYIPPQIWASRKWRLNTVKRYIDKVLCIFPFEKEMYDKKGIDCTFVGHPLLNSLPTGFNKSEFYEKYGLDKGKGLVSIFPGSRMFEIKHLLKNFIKAAEKIKKKVPDVRFVIALAPNLKEEVVRKYLPKDCNIKIIKNENYALLSLSDALILASGTVALEAALYKTPMLISYRGPWFFYLVYLLVRCIKMVSLPNIILGKEVVKELIQAKSNPADIADEAVRILCDGNYRSEMIKSLEQVKNVLGRENSSQKVAEIINLT